MNKEYRKAEFKKVDTIYYEFKPKIKVIKPNGETKWMNIEENELQQIIRILTK